MGLAIVKHVINNHQGEVRVWSQWGKGSTFTIRLRQAPVGSELGDEGEVLPAPVGKKVIPRPAEYLATDEIPVVSVEESPAPGEGRRP